MARRALEESARADLGLPEGGQALEVAVQSVGQSEKTIHFHAEYPWAPGSAIPILAVARKYLERGVIVVKTPHAVRSQFKATGMRMLEASAVQSEGRDLIPEPEGPGRGARRGS